MFELATFLLMTVYKYTHNYPGESVFKIQFLKYVTENYDPFFIGNIIWVSIFIISVIAIINLFLNIRIVNSLSINFLVFLTVILIFLLLFSLLITSGKNNEISGGILQLNVKGTQTVGLSVFTLLHIYLTVSLTVVSFSALKKLYFFRALWITITIIIAMPALVTIFVYNFNDDTQQFETGSQKVDAGVVLGAAVWGGNRPSPVLRERINKCFELFKNGSIPVIVLTGSGSPGELTEAEVSKNELIKKGVDERKIITENRSNSTLEQVSFIKNSLYSQNNWKSVVFISDHFHLFRTKQMAKFFFINSFTVSSDTPISTESTFGYCLKESFAVLLFWLFGIG